MRPPDPLIPNHYYLRSLEPDGDQRAGLIHRHWSVENTCHHVLGVPFGENDCQMRDRAAAHKLSILRDLATKVLRDHPAKKSIRAKPKLAGLDPHFRFSLLAKIPLTSHA